MRCEEQYPRGRLQPGTGVPDNVVKTGSGIRGWGLRIRNPNPQSPTPNPFLSSPHGDHTMKLQTLVATAALLATTQVALAQRGGEQPAPGMAGSRNMKVVAHIPVGYNFMANDVKI